MRARDVLAAAGALAVLAGVAVLVDPGLASVVGLRADRLVVTALALLALLQGLLAVGRRLAGGGWTADLPEVERRFEATVPGDGFDARLAALPGLSVRRRDEERAAVRERLAALAVAVLVARGLDEERARRHLEAGTWTTDERAAAFFVPAADRELSVGTRLRGALGADRAFVRRARRAVAAIVAHADGEAPTPEALADGNRADGTAGAAAADHAASNGGVERE